MQSRVRPWTGEGFAGPPGLGGVAARILADQHQARRGSGLCRELEAATGEERKRLVGFGDDQADGGGAQRLLDGPEEVGLARWAQEVQPVADALGQTAQHRQFGHMGGQDPEERPGMPCCLEKSKGAPATTLGFMDASPAQGECIAGSWISPHPRAPLRQQSPKSRPAGVSAAARRHWLVL